MLDIDIDADIDIDSDTQTEKLQLADHFRIARLTEKKGMRVLGDLKVSMIGIPTP